VEPTGDTRMKLLGPFYRWVAKVKI